jgi:hypothetical protein
VIGDPECNHEDDGEGCCLGCGADLEQAHENRIRRCRSCNAKIVWFKTAAGKNMPVDEDTVEARDWSLDLTRHKSHFATCPNSNQHRKPR